MICRICQKDFTPNKYQPNQKVCSSPSCQHKRQLENLRQWRQKNPYYFIYGRYEVDWKGDYKTRARDWRKRHPGYLRRYRKVHADEYREYMREYMHRYRKALSVKK